MSCATHLHAIGNAHVKLYFIWPTLVGDTCMARARKLGKERD